MYGYKQGPKRAKGRFLVTTWEPEPRELHTIRKMYDWLLKGCSINEVMRRVIKLGLMDQKQLDSKGTKIRRLFQQIAYTGNVWADRKGGAIVPSKHYTEKVVSLEEWHRVQSILKGRRVDRQVRFSAHYCSGLVKCALCGQFYHYYETSVDGGRYKYYKHQEAPWKPKCQGLPKNLPVDYLHSLAEITSSTA